MGKSKAQDNLMRDLVDWYPAAYIDDEVYIGDLIEERGYEISEIQAELGRKPHKMFVDIVVRDSDRTVAFEYHGEQHYSLVGNMTKTTADLLLNQQLDQEKSWILERIGIPLVAVPFDMYVDESVIEHMIDDAYEQMEGNLSELSECPSCGRRFPASRLSHGACKRCLDREREQREDEKKQEQARWAQEQREKRKSAAAKARKKPSWQDFASDGDGAEMSYEEKMKEQAKEYRRQKYQEWKNSPEYAAQKEEARRRRKEAYQRQKAERKMRKLRGED